MFASADTIGLVMDAKYLHGSWFFSCGVEFRGYSGFLIRDRISGKMGNDVCVHVWACVRVGILVPVSIQDISIVTVCGSFWAAMRAQCIACCRFVVL